MPQIRRKRKVRHEVTGSMLLQLRCGSNLFCDSPWGDPPYSPEVLEEMREVWQAYGAEVEAAHEERWKDGSPCWARRMFGPRNET